MGSVEMNCKIEQLPSISAIPSRKQYPGIDASYYLDKSEKGYQNAFEEYAVRMLTDIVMKQKKFPDLRAYLEQIAD